MESSHYFKHDPSLKSRPGLIKTRFRGVDFLFTTDSGVFSRKELDAGSECLLYALIKDLEGKKTEGLELLDLGCGYGAIGIIIKRLFPGLVLNMTDIHPGALKLTKTNCDQNFIKYPKIFHSDALEGTNNRYDIIVTNPPIRAGKSTVFRFYEASLRRLNPGGCLYVVIGSRQGAPSSRVKLAELFGHCETIEIKSGYRVFKCTQNNDEF